MLHWLKSILILMIVNQMVVLMMMTYQKGIPSSSLKLLMKKLLKLLTHQRNKPDKSESDQRTDALIEIVDSKLSHKSET